MTPPLSKERLDELERWFASGQGRTPDNPYPTNGEIRALIDMARSAVWRTDIESAPRDESADLLVARRLAWQGGWVLRQIAGNQVGFHVVQGWTHWQPISPPEPSP